MGIGRSTRMAGRERELAGLRQWLAHAGAGAGGCHVISGEPGVGKSRLAAEAVASVPATWLVTRGRAADRDPPVPFRAIAEALLAASRGRVLPDDPETRAFAAVLGHLVPAWRQGAGVGEPVVVAAEAVLRVLLALAAPAPAVLVVEDVQWADPETLAVLDYLADNAAGQPVAILLTVRSGPPGPGLTLVREMVARRVADVTELGRLGPADVAAMAADCLGGGELDGAGLASAGPDGTGPDGTGLASAGPEADALGAAAGEFLARAGGLPFLVEELIAAAARDGVLVAEGGRWRLTDPAAQVVPDSYRESVRRQLGLLGPAAAHVTRVAAVAGLAVDLRLLSLAAGLSLPETGAAVAEAAASGLLAANGPGRQPGFRHALVRDAVLADLLPGQRAALAAQALDGLTAAGVIPRIADAPGATRPSGAPEGGAPEGGAPEGGAPEGGAPEGGALEGGALELAVDLAEQSGELSRSAALLLTLARRALAGGGLTTAEACLRRALRRTAGNLSLTADIQEALVDLLVHKGDLGELAGAGEAALAALGRLGDDPGRAARVHLRIARAAAAGGDPAWAAGEAGKAHLLAAGDVPLRLAADTATAGAALAEGDLARALGLAQQVIAAGQADRVTLLEAWMIAGRAQRQRDLDAAASAFGAARSLAVTSGSPLAELSALHELATVAMLARAETQPLLSARDRATQLGAVGLAAQLSLQLAGTYALTGRPAEALAEAQRACELARRLHQPLVEAMAMVQAATAHAVREDGAAMEAAATAARALAGGDANVTAGVWGHARTLHALLREDRQAAADALGRAAGAAGRAAGFHGMFWALWGLVSLAGEPPGAGERGVLARLGEPDIQALPANRGLVQYPLAVAAGLRGEREEAGRLVRRAEQVLAGQPGFALWRLLCLRLTAEAALAAGWGDPVTWLRECLAAFSQDGHARVATACRGLLTRAGAPVPRRSAGAAAPPELAALGITAREADVLRLVGEGLSNREIGERLFLSPRTVEKHVERLLTKAGVANRSQLVAWAARAEHLPGARLGT